MKYQQIILEELGSDFTRDMGEALECDIGDQLDSVSCKSFNSKSSAGNTLAEFLTNLAFDFAGEINFNTADQLPAKGRCIPNIRRIEKK